MSSQRSLDGAGMDDVARPDALAEVSAKLLDASGHPHARRGGELHLDWNEARSVLDEEIDFCPRRGAPEMDPRLVAPMLQVRVISARTAVSNRAPPSGPSAAWRACR